MKAEFITSRDKPLGVLTLNSENLADENVLAHIRSSGLCLSARVHSSYAGASRVTNVVIVFEEKTD